LLETSLHIYFLGSYYSSIADVVMQQLHFDWYDDVHWKNSQRTAKKSNCTTATFEDISNVNKENDYMLSVCNL